MGKLEEALEFLDIEDWIGAYTETKHGGADEIRIKECPKCFNDKWKVYINTEKRIWFCQRCQWGLHNGDICQLLAHISGMNVHSVRMEVASTVVPAVSDEAFAEALDGRLNKKEVPEEFNINPIDLPGEAGLGGVTGKRAERYLLDRGMTLDDIEYYEMRISSKLRNKTGPWAVFPVKYYGVPVACQGRKFSGNTEPKYLSSDQIADWMWPLDKKNLERIEIRKQVVLVEGVFDAMAYIRAGIPALCTFGKNLSRSQLKLLQAHGVKRLSLSYDADAHKDIQKAADRIGHLFHTFVIELPPLEGMPKADPGDVLSGAIDESWLLEAVEDAIDTRTPEYWNWKLRKELGE
jgi:ribosomal protein L37AE/L43A